MLEITSLKGDTLPLIDTGQPERIRDIDGTHRISLTVRETELNSVAFAYIENEAILTLDNDKYVIKNIIPRVISDAAEYEIEAEHKFKHDTGTKWIYDVIKGRKVLSLHQALTHCLPPNYTFATYDDFKGYSFEDFGDDWSLALFEKARVSFNFEYIKEGTHLKIYKQIGNKTNKQMRYKHNIVNIEGGLDSTSLSTYIKGTGARDEETGEPLVSATYTSPSAETYDILDAEPVDDERFHNQAELLEYMKSKLQDTVDISYDITYDEFIKATDDDTDVDLGDNIYLKHEVLKEDFQTRIIAVTDYPLSDTLKPIYTISSKKESIIDRQVKANLDRKNLESQVGNIGDRQTEAEKRIEKTIEAVADVENAMIHVDEEMERLENEVIPEIEQAVDSAKIPSQIEPPYPIPTSKLWWDTSINPPRLMRYDGTEWVILAPEIEDIDELIEQMKQDAIREGKEYTNEEIEEARQAITDKINKEIGDATQDFTNQMGELTVSIEDITGRVEATEANIDSVTGDYTSFKQDYAEFVTEMDNFTTRVGHLSDDGDTLVEQLSEVVQESGRIVSRVQDVEVAVEGFEDDMKAFSTTIEQLPDNINLAVSEGIGALEIGGTNLIGHNPSDWYQGNMYESGTNNNTGSLKYVRSSTTDVVGDTKYTLSVYGDYTAYINFYNSDSLFDGTGAQLSTDDYVTFTTPSDAISFRVYLERNDGSDALIEEVGDSLFVKLERGDKSTDWSPAPEDGVNKSNVLSSINLSTEGVTIQGDKVDIAGLVSFMNNRPNLIPLHSSNWENGYIGAGTGNESDRDYAIRMIDYLTIEPNTAYTLNNIAGANIFIREYEEDRFVNNHPTLLSVGNTRTFTTGENSRYIRFYWSNPNVDRIYPEEVGTVYRATFVKGDEALSWEDAQMTLIQGGRIVSNHITANKLDVNEIFGNSAVIAKIQSDSVVTADLSATRITTGTLNAGNLNVINLSGSSLTAGTIDALKVRIRNINASEINAGEINAIDITGSDIYGGILSALNNNTVLNLNTGDFSIGSGADVKFTDSGNRLYYNKNLGAYNHTAGLGFGTSINDRYPFAYLGTVEGGSLSASDQRDFSGFITNTLARTKVDDIGNSAVGQVFHVRDHAVDFNKGIKFDLQSASSGVAYVYPINTGTYSYYLGRVGNKWWEGHFDKIYADVSLGVSGTMYANGQATFNGRLVAHSARQNTVTYTANLNIGVTGGLISRVSSSQKYKLVTEDITLNPYDLLKVNPRMWFDKNNTEQYADLLTQQENGEIVNCEGEKIRRIPGLVAEEVEAAGLGLFVGYDENDEVESVQYDRAWIMLIPIVRDQQKEISQLKDKIKKLEDLAV